MRSEHFHTPGAVTLAVRFPAGSLDIETVDGEDTHVELTPANDAGREALETATVALTDGTEGWRVHVEMEERRRVLLGRSPRVNVRITCPHGAVLELSTVSADVAARGRFRAADVKTVSGDVRLAPVEGETRLKTVSGDAVVEHVGGRLVAQTVSGDVQVTRVDGPAETRSVSGDVRIDHAEAGVKGQTVSGDQVLRAVRAGSIELKSVSGDLVVGVLRGSRVYVDASTLSGSTRSELDLGDEAPSGAEGPLVELRARAMSGDIRLVRA